MLEFINYGNGKMISSEITHNAAKSVVETIKKELPEEAQCISVIRAVLSEAKTISETAFLKL